LIVCFRQDGVFCREFMNRSFPGYYYHFQSRTCCISQGYYCPAAATTYYSCPAGYYCPAGSCSTPACPSGKYGPTASEFLDCFGAKLCSLHYLHGVAWIYRRNRSIVAPSTLAVITTVLLFISQTDIASCPSCPCGQYQDLAAQTGCKACPAVRTSHLLSRTLEKQHVV